MGRHYNYRKRGLPYDRRRMTRELLDDRRNQAALFIQTQVRGHLARFAHQKLENRKQHNAHSFYTRNIEADERYHNMWRRF